MNSHDVVVRIVQPLDQPHPRRSETMLSVFKPENNFFHSVINGFVLSAIGLLALFIGVSYFNLGVSFREIMVIVGIPMTLGIVTSYAIL
jgi:hypothetical protein